MAMTINGFIGKMSGRIVAEAFLKQHREYMLTGELSKILTPIVEKIDNGELNPNIGLLDIRQAAFNYFIDQQTAKAIGSINKKPSSDKMYLAAVYNEDGTIAVYIDPNGEEKDLVFKTDNPLQADNWCYRKLFDAAPNSYAKIVNVKSGYSSEITRDDAISMILRTGPVGAYRKVGSSGTLTNKMKAKGDRFHFSKG